jgi:hypothetical protein
MYVAWSATSALTPAAELGLLNEITEFDRIYANYLLVQQKLFFKHSDGAKVTKRYDGGRGSILGRC